MTSDALTNAIKSVKSNISCAHKPMIHKLFSLPIGPNDVPYEVITVMLFPVFSHFRWSDKPVVDKSDMSLQTKCLESLSFSGSHSVVGSGCFCM